MRCFYVLVHGQLKWRSARREDREADTIKPAGFYCHRFVLASGKGEAAEKAFRRVRENLHKQTGWLNGVETLDLEAEEITTAPVHKLLKSDDRGYSFYGED